jgi:hypothetical protein
LAKRPKRAKRPKTHFLRQEESVPDTWHDAMAELNAIFFGKRDHVTQTQ